jgi:hypothetical protein
MWGECKNTQELRTSTVVVNRVDPDGRYWSNTTVGPFEMEWPRVQACMNEQFRAHPYLDWLKARQASGQPQASAAPAATVGPAPVPAWSVGDEWQYAYQGPAESGSYVWSVNRVEALDGVSHYVVKSGTREIFYRVSDLAVTTERVDGVIVLLERPPRLIYAWPLEAGKSWVQHHRQERPVERQAIERDSAWTVATQETVTVVAGTFRTFKIEWRNMNSRALFQELWYAPDVKQLVKLREFLTSGVRERELIAFKLKGPTAATRTPSPHRHSPS